MQVSPASHVLVNELRAATHAGEPRYAPIRPPQQQQQHFVQQRPDHNTIPSPQDRQDSDGMEALRRYTQSSQPGNVWIDASEAHRQSLQMDAWAPDRVGSEGPPDFPLQMRGRTKSMSTAGGLGTGTDPEKRDRKSLNSAAANEKELRELIDSNVHRSLESIARDVRSAERTQKSEKAKQLFGMRWYALFVKKATVHV